MLIINFFLKNRSYRESFMLVILQMNRWFVLTMLFGYIDSSWTRYFDLIQIIPIELIRPAHFSLLLLILFLLNQNRPMLHFLSLLQRKCNFVLVIWTKLRIKNFDSISIYKNLLHICFRSDCLNYKFSWCIFIFCTLKLWNSFFNIL